jgi:hypothetical protein
MSASRRARLREHLMTEITTMPAVTEPAIRIRRWASPRRIGATVGGIAVATAGAFAGLAVITGPAGLGPTAFAVSPEPHGVVAIHIVSTKASAEQMTRQLRSKGLHIRIATEPASPALVGTWIGVGADGRVPMSVVDEVGNQTEGYAATLEVPVSFPGTLVLDVGVPPRPGQQINVAGLRNALAPGGPLACNGLSGAKPANAAKTLTALGYSIDYWTTRQPQLPGRTPAQSGVVHTPPAGSRVTQVWVHDWVGDHWTDVDPSRERHVIVQVQSPTAATYPYTVWQGFAPSLRTGSPASAGC